MGESILESGDWEGDMGRARCTGLAAICIVENIW
tara:strand:- start:1777 stop:1878 length:102 start_codon:yes stop_codon:yes gene_type:complete